MSQATETLSKQSDALSYEENAKELDLRGNFAEAHKQYAKAIQLDPKNLDLRCNFAVCYGKLGNLQKALDELCLILDDKPDYAPALENLGRVLIMMGLQAGAQGWFSLFEAGHLYRTIQAIDNPEPVIVELGSCYGLSSMIIAKALKNKPNSKIYCVDAWEGDGSSVFGKTRDNIKAQAHQGISFYEIYTQNMQNAGVYEQLTPIQGYTTNVVKDWSEDADLIFVDADHSYEGVRSDVRDWKNFVKVGGQLLMHDVELEIAGSEQDSGPGLVAREFLGPESNFDQGSLVDTLYLTRRNS
ncbi:MAG: class I SAM-dependent methyltransferase [Lentisphaeraceae bacterium]|nr:class I SAM-dependent methyltransferase [Lentisphaeraceae bacterium]